MGLYRNNLKNREFGKEGAQNFESERATIAERLAPSEIRNSEANQGVPKTDSSCFFGISYTNITIYSSDYLSKPRPHIPESAKDFEFKHKRDEAQSKRSAPTTKASPWWA